MYRALAFAVETAIPTSVARTGAVPCHGFRHVEVAGDGARVTYSLTLEMSGIMRLLSVVLRPLLERQVGGDMRRLKALLEGQRYT